MREDGTSTVKGMPHTFQADRSVEALAVMMSRPGLQGLHHHSDKDLQPMIAGERAPCLSANGLWLEARDEFSSPCATACWPSSPSRTAT